MTNREDDGGSFDVLVGQNISALRKARALTQEALAKDVSTRGVPMRQQTLVKIERGNRPLRFREADAIALALGVATDELLVEDAVRSDNLQRLITRIGQVQEAVQNLSGAAHDLAQLQLWLTEEVASLTQEEGPHQELLKEAADIAGWDPVRVAELGVKRYHDGRRRSREVDPAEAWPSQVRRLAVDE